MVTKFEQQTRVVGAASIVQSYDAFMLQFGAYTSNFFVNFNFSCVVVLGECVLASLLPAPEKHRSMCFQVDPITD